MQAYMIMRCDGLYIEQHRDGAATHREPGNKFPPRLWFKEHQAKAWLTSYCKGQYLSKYVETSDWETGAPDVHVSHHIIPVKGRTIDRFQIVPVHLDVREREG